MSLKDKIMAAIIKQILEKGIFDVKKMMKIDRKGGILTFSDLRCIIFPAHDFAVLHDAAEKLAGHAGPIMLRAQGEKSGRIDVQKGWKKNLEGYHIKADLPTILSMVPAVWAPLGWGKPITKGINKETCEGILIVENCFEADSIRELKGQMNVPQCHFMEGFIKGFFSEITGKKVQVEETKCKAAGAEHCEFKITVE